MIKTVVFDVGNVVWRFRPAFDGVYRLWAKKMGINLHQFRLHYYEKDGLYRKFETDTLSLSDWLQKIAPDIDPQVFLQVLDTKMGDTSYFSRYLNPKVINLIASVRQAGFPVGCLSNTENFLFPYYKKYILPLFDYHILSWQVGSRKPDLKIYKQIYKHGKFLPSEILFIDDVPINIATANKIGLNTSLFISTRQLSHDLKKFGILK